MPGHFFNLRDIPSVSSLIEDEEVKACAKVAKVPNSLLKPEIVRVLDVIRSARVQEKRAEGKALSKEELYRLAKGNVLSRLEALALHRSRRVVNATGIIVHTNLGRSPFSEQLWQSAGESLCGYLNLEYDLESGKRSTRGTYVERLLCELSGSESALVVNNCAGAVLLLLRYLCYRKEVIVSRGELVQIGGGFRIPEIMRLAGVKLVEVGTTNQTLPEDYWNAITSKTSAILKVHKSNFQQVGFVSDVNVENLISIARHSGISILEDMGSATLIPESEANKLNLNHPSPSLRLGVDALCFSADKTLGLCQGGIVLGKVGITERLRKSPVYRTLRPDRTLLVLLEEGLSQIAEGKWREIPFYKMLRAETGTLRQRASRLCEALSAYKVTCNVVETIAEIGGGFPGGTISSCGIRISGEGTGGGKNLDNLAELLRTGNPPIITSVRKDGLIVDLRTVFEEEDELILKGLATAYSKLKTG